MADDKYCIGFCFGGDANASLVVWTSAVQQTPQLGLSYKAPEFMFGQYRKSGDLMVGAAGTTHALEFFENKCDVLNREKQHDCMNTTWCYRAHEKSKPVPLPARAYHPWKKKKAHRRQLLCCRFVPQAADDESSHSDESHF